MHTCCVPPPLPIYNNRRCVYIYIFVPRTPTLQRKNQGVLGLYVYMQGCGVGSWESESVETHVFSWNRSRESESVFKTAGVGSGVGFLKLLESGVGVGFLNFWSRSQESEHLLQLATPMFIK